MQSTPRGSGIPAMQRSADTSVEQTDVAYLGLLVTVDRRFHCRSLLSTVLAKPLGQREDNLKVC